jgi:hypothetical protein
VDPIIKVERGFRVLLLLDVSTSPLILRHTTHSTPTLPFGLVRGRIEKDTILNWGIRVE